FYQIGVARPVYFFLTFFREISLRENRVAWRRTIGATRTVADENHFAVVAASAAFCADQEIFAVFFINMGCLYPDWVLGQIYAAVHNNFIGSGNYLVFFEVVIPNFNHAMPAVAFCSSW